MGLLRELNELIFKKVYGIYQACGEIPRDYETPGTPYDSLMLSTPHWEDFTYYKQIIKFRVGGYKDSRGKWWNHIYFKEK